MGLFGQYLYYEDEWGNITTLIDEESAITTLATPLLPGVTYTITFQAMVADGSGFVASDAPLAICGYDGTWPYDPQPGNFFPGFFTQLGPHIIVPATEVWESMSSTFTVPAGPQLTQLILAYDQTFQTNETGGAHHYVMIDEIVLKQNFTLPSFNLPEIVCWNSSDINLTSLISPSEFNSGVFSGSGVYVSGTNYFFDEAVAGEGTHTISYSYQSPAGCFELNEEITVYDDVIVITGYSVAQSCECEMDGAVNIEVAGGTPGYTFSWLGGAISCGTFSGSTEQNLSGLSAGVYQVLVTDDVGCVASASYTVTTDADNSDFTSGVAYVLPIGLTIWDLSDFTDGTVSHNHNIIVPADAYLEIYDLHVRLAPGYRIIVEAKGDCKGVNSHFEPGCGNVWGGFEVQANPTTYFNINNRGRLSLNSCWVNYASIGIRNHSISNFTTVKSGGYMECYNTEFYNCNLDLDLRNFIPTADNTANFGARFRTCRFVIDDDLYATNQNRISLNSVGDIRFHRCELKQDFEDMLDDQQLNGVRSVASAFYWDDCDPNNPGNCYSNVYGFTRGMDITGDLGDQFFQPVPQSVTQRGPVIQRADFRCFRGITCLNVESMTIAFNEFWDLPSGYNLPVFGFTTTGIANATYGISVDGGTPSLTDFQIADNRIAFTSDDDRIGIICMNTGIGNTADFGSLVYHNTIRTCNVAIYMRNSNRNAGGNVGLRFECNIFDGNQHDVWIDATSGTINNPGVRLQQHKTYPQPLEPTKSAGNKFNLSLLVPLCTGNSNANTDTNMGCCDDIDEDLGFVTHNYRYHGLDLNSNVTNEMSTTCGMAVPQLGGPNGCGVFVGILPPDDGEEQRMMATQNYNATKAEWLQLVDGGNTSALTIEVVTTTFADALETYYSLLEESPNLSDEVMIEAVQKVYDLPSVLLTQILSNNPQEAKSEEVQKAIEERLIPLDQWQKEQINQGLGWVSEKEELEAEMTTYLYQREEAIAVLIKNIAQDQNTTNKLEAMCALLEEDEFPQERMWNAALLKGAGNHEAAVDMLLGMTTAFALKPEEEAEINTLANLWQLALELATTEDPQLTEAQLDDLYNVYNGMGNVAGATAMNIMVKYGNFDYEPYLESNPELRNLMTGTTEKFLELTAQVFPNPASNFCILKLVEPMLLPCQVTLHDVTGRILATYQMQPGQSELLINLENYAAQTFMVVLTEPSGKMLQALPLNKHP